VISTIRVLNEEMLDNFDIMLEASPKQLALQCLFAKSTAHVGTEVAEVAEVTAL
jgi:hypothetical protein